MGREAGADSTVEDEEYAGVFRINTASSEARVRSGWVGLRRRGRLLWGRGAALASTHSLVSFIFGVYFPKRRWNEKREMKKRRNFSISLLTQSSLTPSSSHPSHLIIIVVVIRASLLTSISLLSASKKRALPSFLPAS